MNEVKEPKKRKRRNYQRELERVQSYLDVVIRIKQPDETANPAVAAQLHAYRDVAAYMKEVQ